MNINFESNINHWWDLILGKDHFFELSLDLLCVARNDGYFHRVNPAFQKVLGYEAQEFLSIPFVDFVHPDDIESTYAEMEKLKQGIPTVQFENRYKCKNGSYKWLSWKCMPHANGDLYAIARDVSVEKEFQKKLRVSLREKEVLLKEIHHRVKNNLQLISSLINLQIRKQNESPKTQNPLDALIECQNRIQAIALIHEKLYQSEDYAKISFSEYIQSLVHEIFRVKGVSQNTIALEIDIPKIKLEIDKAIPCALIINELVTNSLKHGFPENQRGVIGISMNIEQSQIQLSVKDSGVGLPHDMDIQNSPSLGLQLVCTLINQLNGTLLVSSKNGVTFSIQFPR